MTLPDQRLAAGVTPSQALTIAELAERAGVSTATVSKVINGRSQVAAETRAVVEDLIRTYGYRRQRRRGGSSRPLEVVFHELAGDYPIEVVKGVQQVAQQHHLAVVISELHGSHTPGHNWLEDLLGRHPSGVITVFSELSESQRRQLATRQIPVVVMDPAGEPGLGVPSVGAANWSGGLVATRHLLELGHRRVGMISGPAYALSSRARVDGYRAALDMAGIPADRTLIRPGDFQIEDGITGTRELMRLKDPPTAIFACNDGQATGVYWAAHELGMRIPDELSVIGFDDMPAMRWAIPPLTTIRQPLTEMAATAATMLVALVQERPLSQSRIELGTELVVRGSTAPPGERS